MGHKTPSYLVWSMEKGVSEHAKYRASENCHRKVLAGIHLAVHRIIATTITLSCCGLTQRGAVSKLSVYGQWDAYKLCSTVLLFLSIELHMDRDANKLIPSTSIIPH